MEEKCLCEQSGAVIFSCCGSSNVGQMANQAAIRLAQQGVVRYFCISGIGGHVSGMIESAKSAEKIVAVDGCPTGCSKKTLEHAGLHIGEYLQVTDLGIEKNRNFNPGSADVDKVVNEVSVRIGKKQDG
jgi:uncharacterized metal-binding protein